MYFLVAFNLKRDMKFKYTEKDGKFACKVIVGCRRCQTEFWPTKNEAKYLPILLV